MREREREQQVRERATDRGRDGGRKGKHVRRLNVTEGLLFVVLWGGSGGGKRERDGGRRRDGEEGDSGNSALAEDAASRQTCRPRPPDQISSAIIRLMLLRRRPAHWKPNCDGTRLNTLQ